jgi:hypothetical protein
MRAARVNGLQPKRHGNHAGRFCSICLPQLHGAVLSQDVMRKVCVSVVAAVILANAVMPALDNGWRSVVRAGAQRVA